MAPPDRSSSSLLQEVAESSLLGLVPGFLELALDKGDVRLCPEGTAVCQQGAPVTHLMIPLDDRLRLMSDAPGERASQPRGYLKPGRALAFRNLLSGTAAEYWAFTDGPTSVLAVPAQSVLSLLARHPLIDHYLRCMVQCQPVRQLKGLLEERGATQDDLFEAISFVPAEAASLEAGEELVIDEPSLVFVESGTLRVALLRERTGAGEEERDQVEVQAGVIIGGESMIPPWRTSYVATASSPVTYRRLKAARMQPLLERFGMIDHLVEEPWLPRAQTAPGLRERLRGALSALPGMILDPSDAQIPRASTIDPSTISTASTDAESIVSSVENVARLLGAVVPRTTVEAVFGSGGRVTSMRVAELLEPHGLQVRSFQTTVHDLARQVVPALVMFGPRLCVLAGTARGHVILLDAARGFVRVEHEDFVTLWDQRLLEVRRVVEPVRVEPMRDDGEPVERRPRARGRVLRDSLTATLREFAGPSLNALGLAFCISALGLVTPIFSQMILDEALALREVSTLAAAATGLLLVTLFTIGLSVARSILLSELDIRLDYRLSSRFYRHALSLPSAAFGDRRAGEVLARMNELSGLRSFASNEMMQIIANVLSVVLSGAILMTYSPTIAIVPVCGVAVVAAIHLAMRGYIARQHDAAFEAASKASSLLAEQVEMVMTVKALGAEEDVRRRWEVANVEERTLRRRTEMLSTALEGVSGFIAQGMIAIGVWLAAVQALKGQMTPGAVLAASMYLQRLVGPLMSLAGLVTRIEQIRVAYDKVSRMFETEPEETVAAAEAALSVPLRGKIRFEDVSFRYDEDSPWVLRNVSFTIYPKQVVAIAGRSGCGKTTLMGLITGTLRPTSGRIFFDDVDAAVLSLTCRRQQLGLIVQQRDLFAGSLADNLAFSDDAPTNERLRRAADEGNALEFIERMPKGFDYYLAAGGMGLSGGQKQRLCIARTLYREPRILLLDEATSALDIDSERKVMDRMREIMAGKTAILIAHRLSTIRLADVIFVMKDGQLVERGPHAELMARGGHYFELFGRSTALADGA